MEQRKTMGAWQKPDNGAEGGAGSGLDLSIDRSLDALMRSVAGILSAAEEINQLVGTVALTRDRLRREMELAQRERDVLSGYVRELKAATEVETTEMRERARRESEAMLSEAQAVRARAQENARRVEARILATEKRTRLLLRGLLSSADAAEVAKIDLELDNRFFDRGGNAERSQEGQDKSEVSAVAAWCAQEVKEYSEESGSDDLTEANGQRHDSWMAKPAQAGQFSEPSADDHTQSIILGENLVDRTDFGAEAVVDVDGDTEAASEALSEECRDSLASISSPSVKSSRYRLFVHPMHGFSKIEELEALLGEIECVDQVRISGLESQGVVFDLSTNTSQGELLNLLTSRIQHARLVRAENTELELELTESLGAR